MARGVICFTTGLKWFVNDAASEILWWVHARTLFKEEETVSTLTLYREHACYWSTNWKILSQYINIIWKARNHVRNRVPSSKVLLVEASYMRIQVEREEL